jgi:hypothetical protein
MLKSVGEILSHHYVDLLLIQLMHIFSSYHRLPAAQRVTCLTLCQYVYCSPQTSQNEVTQNRSDSHDVVICFQHQTNHGVKID